MTKIETRCWPSNGIRARRGEFLGTASVSLALIAAISFSAHAATVKALQGQVLVNSGQGYRLVDGSTQLEPGATVVANPGAVAQVGYAGGCVVTVQPGSLYLVASQPPCQTGEPTQSGGLTDKGGSSGTSGTVWAIGAAAIGAGGAAAYFLLKPTSP
jgi:hypothetical protein